MLDGAFLSHAIFWFIGAVSLLAVVGAVAALFTMGRQGARKD